MDNNDSNDIDNDILNTFGGVEVHNLNNILKSSDDSSEENGAFSHSPYFDLDSISNINLPNKRTFEVLTINIQSIQAKFNIFLSFL